MGPWTMLGTSLPEMGPCRIPNGTQQLICRALRTLLKPPRVNLLQGQYSRLCVIPKQHEEACGIACMQMENDDWLGERTCAAMGACIMPGTSLLATRGPCGAVSLLVRLHRVALRTVTNCSCHSH